jgi:hypothetical protein
MIRKFAHVDPVILSSRELAGVFNEQNLCKTTWSTPIARTYKSYHDQFIA